MTLEQRTFWIKWYDAAIPPGGVNIDIPVGRNIELEGWGGCREDALLVFRLFCVWENGALHRIVPRSSTVANEDWIILPSAAEYDADFREVPLSSWRACDVQAFRVQVANAGAVNKYAYGHLRGKIYG
jgi:hypothetical protein